MWDHNESSAGGRQANSDLVNSLVLRDENGHYQLDLNNAFVTDRRRGKIIFWEENM